MPGIYGDGDYVLGHVWYGGIHFPLKEERNFSDFWSCAYVRIRGGKKVGGRISRCLMLGEIRRRGSMGDGALRLLISLVCAPRTDVMVQGSGGGRGSIRRGEGRRGFLQKT